MASDACSDVTWSNDFDALSDDCGATGTAVTFIATDDCGNSSSTTAKFTIVDSAAPAFTYVPADYTISCEEELVYEDATAEDACGDVTVSLIEEIILDDACHMLTRLFVPSQRRMIAVTQPMLRKPSRLSMRQRLCSRQRKALS